MHFVLTLGALVFAMTGGVVATATSAPAAAKSASKPILIGIWVKPRQPGPTTVAQVEKAIGRHFDYALHYQRLDAVFPNADELDDKANGRIPIVSLNCGRPITDVAAGAHDADLGALAASISAFGKPVEMRYCWEMNDIYRHIDAQDFIPAWRHVHDLFAKRGVKNVRWYFCPGADDGAQGAGALAYYPGDAYVDDVGIDTYDRKGQGFRAMIDTPYHVFDRIAKPFIIGETGALGTLDQGTFLGASSAATLHAAYPKLAAVVYFDAAGPHGDWSFTPQGLSAFGAFAKAAAHQ